MATASATHSPATLAAAATPKRKSVKVNYITGLHCFGGLKAHNNVTSLGLPVTTEQSFAKVVSLLRSPLKGKGGGGGGGGALSSRCSNIEEIFKIAAIVNGLVLVGVAVGFALLLAEASVEEAAESD